MTKRDPQALFSDISGFVERSNAIIEAGNVTELTGLDDNIRELCEEVLALSPSEREQFADQLQALLADLQALGETLVLLRDQVADEIGSLTNRKRAATAYRTVDISDGGGKKPEDE